MAKVTAEQMTQVLVSTRANKLLAQDTSLETKYVSVFDTITATTAKGRNSCSTIITEADYNEFRVYFISLGYTVGLFNSGERSSVSLTWPIPVIDNTVKLTAVSPDQLALVKDVVYYARIFPTGGVAPYTFTQLNGTLPNGITLSTTNDYAVISGTPTVTGNDYITLVTKDSLGTQVTNKITWATGAVVSTLLDLNSSQVSTSTILHTASTNTLVLSNTAQLTDSNITIDTNKIRFLNTNIPISSIGQLGDLLGTIAVGSNYIYYCTATYVTVPVTNPITPQPAIWKRVLISNW
jgi:hypothetical protein